MVCTPKVLPQHHFNPRLTCHHPLFLNKQSGLDTSGIMTAAETFIRQCWLHELHLIANKKMRQSCFPCIWWLERLHLFLYFCFYLCHYLPAVHNRVLCFSSALFPCPHVILFSAQSVPVFLILHHLLMPQIVGWSVVSILIFSVLTDIIADFLLNSF